MALNIDNAKKRRQHQPQNRSEKGTDMAPTTNQTSLDPAIKELISIARICDTNAGGFRQGVSRVLIFTTSHVAYIISSDQGTWRARLLDRSTGEIVIDRDEFPGSDLQDAIETALVDIERRNESRQPMVQPTFVLEVIKRSD